MSESEEGQVPPRLWAMDLRGTAVPPLVQVRRWASRTLGELSDEHLGDVLLVATELITNAYDHGNGSGEVRMSYTPRPCHVRIEVDDNSAAHPVLLSASTSPRGRGVFIVNNLARTWGVLDHPAATSKTVWADICCEGAGRSRCVPAAAQPN
ncbi:ATP-binding protein [Amycolatopsis sp. NPDC059657]|uniref:ATP-binding protein n=1 Tax=Amycolatopsis sp. NPDC059657 TaxID=3346899 RepID=UPI0036714BA1